MSKEVEALNYFLKKVHANSHKATEELKENAQILVDLIKERKQLLLDKDSLHSFIVKTEECKVDICIEGTNEYIKYDTENRHYKVAMIYAITENHLEVHVVKEVK